MEAPFSNRQRSEPVAKPELGTKRICGSCGTKFYDLARDPILCPKCGTLYEIVAIPTRVSAAKAAPPVPTPVAEEPEPVAPAGAEVISLEEAAEAETKAGAKKNAAGDIEGDEEEVEIAGGGTEDDNTFLEPDEEESNDVSDLIGEGIEEKEEEN
jgi:uncharacterized protein (TIGR02300 family)